LKLIDFIFAARPMLLLPVWSLYLIANNFYFGPDSFDLYGFIALVSLTLLVAGAYYINQIYDYQSDLINKKIGFLQSGKISKNEMIIVYITISAVSIITGFKISLFLGVVFCSVFVLGYIYSAPPLRLKDRPLLGLLSNSFAYGILVPLSIPGIATKADYLTMIMPTYFFMIVSAGYLLTIIPDREGDTAGLGNESSVFNNHIIGIGSALYRLPDYPQERINSSILQTSDSINIAVGRILLSRLSRFSYCSAISNPFIL